jgi:hypothetical protein
MSTRLFGTVVSVEFNVDIKYFKKDATYKGAVLKYKTDAGDREKAFSNKLLDQNAKLTASLKSLNPGDKFEMTTVKNDQGYVNVQDITKNVGNNKNTQSNQNSQSKKADNFVIGQIKGNTVTNAVALAAARAGDLGVTLDDLIDAANDVLQLHAHLEKADIASAVFGTNDAPTLQEMVTSVEEENILSDDII